MERIGLVLAGGGGKGAYQIGVWKYLEECGLAQHICAVSGTSVGALNAAMFSAGNYDAAEHIWINIAPNKILSPKEIEIEKIVENLIIALGACLLNDPIVVDASIGMLKSHIAYALEKMLRRNYMFSREGLVEIMDNEVDFPAICNSLIPCYATCLNLSNGKPQRFLLNEQSADNIKKILLASSAIPVVFDTVNVEGTNYYDGGIPIIGDNVPIQPLYDLGIENIIVVQLDQQTPVDKSKYPNSRIIEIVPSEKLGGLIDGTLDFNSEGAVKRIEHGYEDAKSVFGTFVETVKIEKINQILMNCFCKEETEFQRNRQMISEKREALKLQKANDGFDEMLKDLGCK